MSMALYVAAFLSVAISVAHSVLGERYILMRLSRKESLPKVVSRTLRFAWHITSIAWCGFAVILVLLARGDASGRSVSMAVGATFALSGLVVLFSSRGRHLAWVVFSLIAILSALY
jgi:branched-subunit amino acid transport protein